MALMGFVLLSSFGAPEPQALCALRDPVRQIARLFPDADAYESLVGTVGQETRQGVAKRLPFTLHFDELGRHTLYVAKKQERPVGLVHVRSEAGRWGLVEIAWALDMDLRVIGYEFQRCRDRSKSALTKGTGREAILHKGFQDLMGLMSDDGGALAQKVNFVPKSARPLAATVLRSGLKTIAVTESVWPDEIAAFRALSLALRYHPEAREAVPYRELFDEKSLGKIKESIGSESTGIHRAGSIAHAILDAKGKRRGWVVETPWELDGDSTLIRWCFDLNGVVRSVGPRGGWKSEELRAAFASLVGAEPAHSFDCCGASGVLVLEVLLGLGIGQPLSSH
jgi:hypothetical protein